MVDFAIARANMVESQIRPNRVTDPRLIDALARIPREAFLPEPLRSVAYVDENIDLGGGRYLLAPLVLARLLEAAGPRPTDIALDIGCASGYSAAVLAHLCDTVVGVESEPGLAAGAGAVLAELGVDNAAVIEGALADGFAKQAPYDVILFGGAIHQVPDTIARQLAADGRVVAVVVDESGVGRGMLMTRSGDALSGQPVFDATAPPLPGFDVKADFVF